MRIGEDEYFTRVGVLGDLSSHQRSQVFDITGGAHHQRHTRASGHGLRSRKDIAAGTEGGVRQRTSNYASEKYVVTKSAAWWTITVGKLGVTKNGDRSSQSRTG